MMVVVKVVVVVKEEEGLVGVIVMIERTGWGGKAQLFVLPVVSACANLYQMSMPATSPSSSSSTSSSSSSS